MLQADVKAVILRDLRDPRCVLATEQTQRIHNLAKFLRRRDVPASLGYFLGSQVRPPDPFLWLPAPVAKEVMPTVASVFVVTCRHAEEQVLGVLPPTGHAQQARCSALSFVKL